MNSPNVSELPVLAFHNYFTQRGFSAEDRQRIGAQLLSHDQIEVMLPGLEHLYSDWAAAVFIPYTGIDGNPTEAYIVRFLSKRAGGFGLPPKQKALHPKGIRPRMHFPRNNPPFKKDTIVYLCESVLKAETVSKLGYVALGVNGCWGFRDRSSTDQIIDDLRNLPWPLISELRVFYDSNYSTNDSVKLAVSDLAKRLELVVGFKNTKVTILPPSENGDWGVDDAVVAMGPAWVKEILDKESEDAELSDINQKLLELNEECCIVEDIGRIVKYSCHPIIDMTSGVFTRVNYGSWTVPGEKGRISVAEAWLRWEHAHKVPRMIMAPYEPKMVPGKHLNLWIDPEIQVSESSKVWIDFLHYLIPDEYSRSWLNQWIGYLVQSPGKKMATYAILVGPQGVGKTLLTLGVEAILGRENCAMIGQEELESDFTALWATKLFVAINEFYSHKKETGNKLKRIVTETSTRANKKYGAEWVIDSVTNYMITTNELGALKLDEDDRRAGVIDCSPNGKQDERFFESLAKEIRTNPGGILGFYSSIDLSGFNPFGSAPKTQAKSHMTELRRTGVDQLAWRLAHEPVDLFEDLRLHPDTKYVSLSTIVDRGWELAGFNIHNKNAESHAVLGRMATSLKSHGLKQWMNGKQISVNGVRQRVIFVNGGTEDAPTDVVAADLARNMSKIQGGHS
jgi:hypothetical protein